jgi:hypothetical protein
VGRAEDQNRQVVEETGSGRGPEDTLFGTRRTDGQSLNPLLARMAQANALRQAHGLGVSVDEGERQGADLCISILRRSRTLCGESCAHDHPRRASVGSA